MNYTKLWLGLVALLLTACVPVVPIQPGEPPVPPPTIPGNVSDELANTSWQLVSFGPTKAAASVLPGSTITLDFGVNGKAGGHGGCNSYGGSYNVRGDQISFGEMASTLIACADSGVTQQEQQYLQAFASADRFERSADTLNIWYANSRNVLNFARAGAVPTSQPATPLPTVTPAPPGGGIPGEPTRINFNPGETSATRSADLPAGGVKAYVLRASAGQSMHVQTVGWSAPVNFTIRGPGGTTWHGEMGAADVFIFTAQVTLPEDGDYVVTLNVPPDARATRYDVVFTIVDGAPPATPAPTNPPERIQFAPGTTSAQRDGLLASGPGGLQYVLAASAGQTMIVDVTSDGAPLSLTITEPSGTQRFAELSQEPGGYRIGHQFVLPESGDYLVTVGKADHTPSTNYTVVFTIN